MKLHKLLILASLFFVLCSAKDGGCEDNGHPANTSALDEQAHTEENQRDLMKTQPPPTITWSLERDNLISRFKLQNDRSVNFFMYVFIEGVADPIGYYQVNKVSSVNSQLTNTMQIISGASSTNNIPTGVALSVPSPAEDGSYGTNGDGVFGFTPEGIYIETNMKYITATVPLNFTHPVNRLAIITTEEAKSMLGNSKKAMGK
jgi:hypothetical protein